MKQLRNLFASWAAFRSFCAFCASVLALGLQPAAAASFPDKPVRIVVAYSPGGATDTIARLLAKQLSAQWGQQVVVDNKPGASGMIGAETVVRSAADGYTLLLGYAPEVALNKLVFKTMTYDPTTDLTPLTLVSTAPLVLVTGPKLPLSSMKELQQREKSSVPLSYGSPGIGGQQHIAGALLGQALGIPTTQIPYKGTAPAVVDLLGGQIDYFFATTPPLLQHIQSGKLKALAVAGPTREPLLPDVPTMVELGFPKIQIMNWFGLFAPKGLPAALADQIAGDTTKALADPGVSKALRDLGLTPAPMRGPALRDFLASEMSKYTAFIAETGITGN